MHLKPGWARGRREADSRKGERGEGDKQGEGTSWVILHKASTFL